MRPEELLKLLSLPGDNREKQGNNDALLASLRDSYRFSPGFTGRVMQAIRTSAPIVKVNDLEARINSLFMKIALSGVAAIVVLAISVFISGGTLSFDSLLGLGNSSVESMIYLLSGN
ncbi:MAG TPA: hypothetical protein VMV74_04865 [Bacteroidales bacterium]|nr:hypothetical protein [Bacteroidales bacterium]